MRITINTRLSSLSFFISHLWLDLVLRRAEKTDISPAPRTANRSGVWNAKKRGKLVSYASITRARKRDFVTACKKGFIYNKHGNATGRRERENCRAVH